MCRLIAPHIVFGTSVFLSVIASSVITLIAVPGVQKSRASVTRGIKFYAIVLNTRYVRKVMRLIRENRLIEDMFTHA